jgi:hypothetical protein
MTWKNAMAVTLAALLLTAQGAPRAQDDPEADPGKAPVADDKAGAADSGQGEATPAPTRAPQESGDDPFDYRASEQISEDLSVSFPVDI